MVESDPLGMAFGDFRGGTVVRRTAKFSDSIHSRTKGGKHCVGAYEVFLLLQEPHTFFEQL